MGVLSPEAEIDGYLVKTFANVPMSDAKKACPNITRGFKLSRQFVSVELDAAAKK